MTETNTADVEDRKIKHVIATMSGKGGVGKSLVTGLLASGLQHQGLQVGILDGDLTGPTIASMFGAEVELSIADSGKIVPMVSRDGIKVMSMSMYLENETDPTVWQGTIVASAFKQFYSEVEWGELDYLLIDVPPGTSDVPITVLRSLPLDGVIIVSTPQRLAKLVVKKCINMVHQLKGTIVGIVENMAYFEPSNGERYEVFGLGSDNELVAMAEAPLLAQLPMDPDLTALCDAGRVEEYHDEVRDVLAANFLKALENKQYFSLSM